ncbi:AraC family transcriptional regulator [Paenibacillus sp. J5C_2022]|uniref:helix-turn-helix transcriptional regulator n=1 Tax=Paenibacillus sp. J5C2022 TaxID=2977129 RepID=UPI0021CE08D6|nr:AraC family transcriptional regulator [Paenibacillus sp. J5C2022]MCU6710642.1 AraC family transcriptional regulator [Paenibacillus sp. J5C2022]
MRLKDYGHERAEFLYHTPSEWEKSGQLWMVRGGRSIAKPSYQAGPKRMDCYSLHVVIEGELLFECDDMRITAREGDLVCLFPDHTYTYRRSADCDSLRLSWLVFDGPGAAALLQEAGVTTESPCLRGRWSPALQALLDALFCHIRERSHPGMPLRQGIRIQGELMHFFAELLKHPSTRSEPRSQGWLAQSLQHMELHATEGLTVEQLAAMAGMNRNYFSSAFSRHVGQSPLQYMTAIRMRRAAELLKETDASITEIAYSLGYGNPFAFTRAFTRHYKQSPTAYRRQ